MPLQLVAYRIPGMLEVSVQPASWQRDWMTGETRNQAYRCLPLKVANQAGWVLLCPCDVEVSWAGGPKRKDVSVRLGCNDVAPEQAKEWCKSHFGWGLVTFRIPFLVRTPPGYDLLVRGPSNQIKHGIQPVEGLVETDWATATISMHWKLTAPNQVVRFQAGEPYCMITPIKRGVLEEFEPVMADLEVDPQLQREFRTWCEHRHLNRVYNTFKSLRDTAFKGRSELDYARGVRPGGKEVVSDHRTSLKLRSFRSHEESGTPGISSLTNTDERLGEGKDA